ncbi:MAG: hypothetical protein ABFS86_06460 [Planctomycetota bacterium]
MRLLTVALIAAVLAACSAPAAPEPPSRSESEFDICEAAFRHQFANNASAVQQKAAAYFLEIRGKDPTPEFLARFADHTPPVKAGSAFETGKGLKFHVESIEWLGDDRVKVSGGYYEASLSASGNEYVVERKGDGWKVTNDTMLRIS